MAYASRLREAQIELQRGQPDHAARILRLCDPKLCSWEHAYLFRQARNLQFDLKHTSWIQSVAFSPDDKRIASASSDGTVKVWDARIAKERGKP